MANYLVLACDGGGIRGYLSSLILQKLNNDYSIFESPNGNINFYAGTSTGGLIALALAAGKTIDEIVQLYEDDGAKIFHPLGIQGQCLRTEVDREGGIWTDAKEFLQVLYDNTETKHPSLLTVLHSFIRENRKLSSLTPRVMVATFQLDNTSSQPPSWSPLVIDNFPNSPGVDTHLYDAALSTSAAPVYFPPYYHPTFGWCADGGLFANNPAALAIGRALETGSATLPGGSSIMPQIVLLSIGTGLNPASMSPTKENRLCYGLRHWAWFETHGSTPPFAVLNGMMDGVSASTDQLCGQLLGGNYRRVNPILKETINLNDHSPKAMRKMRHAAEKYFSSSEWPIVTNWIQTTFQPPPSGASAGQ